MSFATPGHATLRHALYASTSMVAMISLAPIESAVTTSWGVIVISGSLIEYWFCLQRRFLVSLNQIVAYVSGCVGE